jgi:hypothetical protein
VPARAGGACGVNLCHGRGGSDGRKARTRPRDRRNQSRLRTYR